MHASSQTLSVELQEVYKLAQDLAIQTQQPEVDAFHLFYVLIKTNKKTIAWLHNSGCDNTEDLSTQLKEHLTQEVLNPIFPEPTKGYLVASETAMSVAIEQNSPTILPEHLLVALLRVSDRLLEWLTDNGIAPAPFENTIATPVLDDRYPLK